jgi:DNA-binding transcriptional LysR family regulator
LTGRVVKLVELAESPLVCRTGSSTLNELAKLGVRLNLAVQCEAPDAVKASVYKGTGVGILHWESVKNDIAAGMLKQIHVPELEKLQVRSYIIYDERKPLTPVAQAFLELLREKGKTIIPKLSKTIEAFETLPIVKQSRVSHLKRLNHRHF